MPGVLIIHLPTYLAEDPNLLKSRGAEKKTPTQRSHKDRAIGDIAPILKSIIRDEKASAKDQQFKDLVTDAFVKAYGIDITKH